MKNGVLYIGGGVETFVDVQKGGVGDGGATLGYSEWLQVPKLNFSQTF